AMIRKAAQPSKAWTEKSSVDGRLKSARLALRKIGPRDPHRVYAASDFPDKLGKMSKPRPFSAYAPIEVGGPLPCTIMPQHSPNTSTRARYCLPCPPNRLSQLKVKSYPSSREQCSG